MKKTVINNPKERYAPFTLAYARLLENCIDSLEKLDRGQISPKTPAQEQFLRVCRGKALPRTDYEKAYISWRQFRPDIRQMLMRAEKAESQIAKEAPRQSSQRDLDRPIQEVIQAEKARQERVAHKNAALVPKKDFQPRFLEEPLGNREDWKRERGRNKFNGR